MRWTGYLARIMKTRNEYEKIVLKLQINRSLWKPRRNRDGSVRINRIGNWIKVPYDRVQWRTSFGTEMNPRVS